MEQCITDMPGDWQAHFLAGAAYEVAGRVPTAEARYESALKLEERPEIYLALSLLQYANGEPEAGLRNAEKATGFNLKFANSYDSDLRAQLWWKAKERERRLKAEAH